MKFFLLTTLISLSAFANVDEELKSLSRLDKELQTLIQKATTCVPGENALCTGHKFSEQSWKEIKNYSLETCSKEIEKQNFKLVPHDRAKKYQDFLKSTLRAQTLYPEKVVLFKKANFTKIDCIHELLHIYQHDSKLNTDLSPATRFGLQQKMIDHLNKAITNVESAEKSGDKKQAIEISNKLQQFINSLEDLKTLDQWFDEKDVHYFIYLHCDELKCDQIDRDVALSNLYKLKSFFPQKIAQKIEQDSKALVHQKEQSALKNMHKHWKRTEFAGLSGFLALSWNDLFKKFKAEGIKFYKVNSDIKFKELESFTIDQKTLKTLPEAPAEFLKNSKIAKGEAFAKFSVIENNKIIFVTPITTRSALVHEYLHYLQHKNNSSYADALKNGPVLKQNFENGKITREFFEEMALMNNALVWMGELEVYSALVKEEKLISPLENLNNKELYLHYQNKVKVQP